MKPEKPEPAKMDESFTPANIGKPPQGTPLELWHGSECIKGYKKDGTWHAEDGTTIGIGGWRLIGGPKDKPEPEIDVPASQMPSAQTQRAKRKR